uniref:bone marrow stromal antigen 2 n=1 Tax=Jaculus jaculus TaxID=51337 RepID=UPI001E1B31E1|nr:bone marrow stromal antigen 2 [Jaculus jaculus]
MDERWKEDKGTFSKSQLIIGVIAMLVALSLIIPLIIFAVRAYSEACQNIHQAERACRNGTHLLQGQLTQAQEGLLKVETQAHTCNQTVVTLKTSLQKQQAQSQEQQAHIQDLERNIINLNRRLQDIVAELEQLRKEKKASRQVPVFNFASSLVTSSLLRPIVLLILVLGALML